MGAMANILLVGTAQSGPALANRAIDTPIRNVQTASAPKEFGVMSDAAEQSNLDAARRAIELIQATGFSALKESVWIDPGNQGFKDLDPRYQRRIENSLVAAGEANLPVTLALEQHAWPQPDSKRFTPPLSATKQTGFCRVGAELVKDYPIIKKVSVGVEPNNDYFWDPQYNQGVDAVARPYVSLLAKCYQLIKVARPDNPPIIIGGELASGGNDNPHASNGDHSPATEIANMCRAYARSKYDGPLFDWFSIHGYTTPGETLLSRHPDSGRRGIGDYKALNKELQCFVQPSKAQIRPKIIFGEVGLPTDIPAGERHRYTFRTGPLKTSVPEEVAGAQLAAAIHEVNCNYPNAVELDQFQLVDDRSNLDTGLLMPPPSTRDTSSAFSGMRAKDSYKIVKNQLSKVLDGTDCS